MALVGAAVTNPLCTASAAMLAPAAVNTGVDSPELDESQSCSRLACAAASTSAGYAEVVETLLKASATNAKRPKIRAVVWA